MCGTDPFYSRNNAYYIQQKLVKMFFRGDELIADPSDNASSGFRDQKFVLSSAGVKMSRINACPLSCEGIL